jgi:N4-gp56 family major capsid protein
MVDYVAQANQYNDPLGGTDSTVGGQVRTDHYVRKALIDAKRNQYFLPMSGTTNLPKHMGKKIKKYIYVPMLDDRNTYSEGLDTSGSKTAGNLYGSSKDIGTIAGKLPVLSETGGRVNKVGHTRQLREGTIQKYGIFEEFTQESLDFDSDADLKMHINREMLNGASEVTEDVLQMDLLTQAGTVRYAGTATQDSEVDDSSVMAYDDFVKLSIDLDQNRTPRQKTILTGTRLIDTAVVAGTRVLYAGSELIPTMKQLTDYFNNPAFLPVEKYAAGTTLMNGEVGAIDQFRIVCPPEMQHWANAGATSPENTFRGDTNYDIFPMLCVGEGSFTTIGFQSDGEAVRFKIISKNPGEETADRIDPYGETGFMSCKWYYGFFLERPERLAVYKVAAKL